MTRRVPWIISVLLSRSFLWISSLVFSKTQHGVRGPYGNIAELDFWKKKIFAPKNRRNRSSLRFFECMWKFSCSFFFSIRSIMQVYINCCMLGKIFKSTISLELNDEKVWFSTCWYKFIKIKSWLKILGCVWYNQNAMNRINWLLVSWYKFRKA